MEWARSRPIRVIAALCAVGLMVLYRDERNAYFWLGVTLLTIAVARLLLRRGHAEVGPSSQCPSAEGSSQPRSWVLADLLKRPLVAHALSEGPARWRQVCYFDHEFDPQSPTDLASYVWLYREPDWCIGLGDELKPFIDLDIPEEADAVLDALRGHPGVSAARHEDREVYEVDSDGPMELEEFAALAVRALTAGQLGALRRAGPGSRG